MSASTCDALMAVGTALLLTSAALAWRQRSLRRRAAHRH
jgi:hypothetical protein